MQRHKMEQSISLPTEYDVQNPASNLLGIVWTKRGLTMQCANPQCSKQPLVTMKTLTFLPVVLFIDALQRR